MLVAPVNLELHLSLHFEPGQYKVTVELAETQPYTIKPEPPMQSVIAPIQLLYLQPWMIQAITSPPNPNRYCWVVAIICVIVLVLVVIATIFHHYV